MRLIVYIISLTLLLVHSSFAQEQGSGSQLPEEETIPLQTGSVSESNTTLDLMQFALTQIGVPYHWGGVSPDIGVDCSGYVRYVFDKVAGIELPHSAKEISEIGQKIDFSGLQPGDLVFFKIARNIVSHVGIYLGNNQFIHDASVRTGGVQISDINEYWVRHFKLARRLDLPSVPLAATAEFQTIVHNIRALQQLQRTHYSE
jgi:cell wall-associated NlpC family hydrolase